MASSVAVCRRRLTSNADHIHYPCVGARGRDETAAVPPLTATLRRPMVGVCDLRERGLSVAKDKTQTICPPCKDSTLDHRAVLSKARIPRQRHDATRRDFSPISLV